MRGGTVKVRVPACGTAGLVVCVLMGLKVALAGKRIPDQCRVGVVGVDASVINIIMYPEGEAEARYASFQQISENAKAKG